MHQLHDAGSIFARNITNSEQSKTSDVRRFQGFHPKVKRGCGSNDEFCGGEFCGGEFCGGERFYFGIFSGTETPTPCPFDARGPRGPDSYARDK